jgi:small redox-active disulfide protein 2
MIDIKVLGPGCANCERLERMTLEALSQLEAAHPGIEIGFEKVSDPMRFHEFGILNTPGLVINQQVVISGRLPTQEQIQGWLQAALPE